MLAILRSIWNPMMYHGHGRRRNFFEGWYFKFVDASEQHVHAVIPGIFLGRHPDASHAFVQILDGLTGRSTYTQYPLDVFHASEREFDVHIGPNHFRADGFSLALDTTDRKVRGELCFTDVQSWPVSALSPGIMGWYAFVPFMECYHGVGSFDHALHGALSIDGTNVNFDGGRGYIEKDWGQAFPQSWVWVQSNHFGQPRTCLTASVANIPWLGSAFRGFIIGLWRDGRLYRFATYTGARIESLRLTDTLVVMRAADRRHRLEIEATRTEGGLLQAPYRTDMLKRVTESLTATVDVRLVEREGGRDHVVFEGQGRHVGLEINGELKQLLD